MPVLTSLTLLAFFAGCNLNTDYFADYRGKNLLGNSDFGSGKWALVSNSDSTSTAYNPTPSDYMTWEGIAAAGHPIDGSASTPTKGPDGVSPSYRLEIKNLIPDGDFEGEATGNAFPPAPEAFWSQSTGTPSVSFKTSGTSSGVSNSISHQSLLFNSSATSGILSLAIDTAVNTAPNAGFWNRKGSYQFRFDFYNYSPGTTFDLTLAGPGVANVFNNGNWAFSNLPTASSPTLVPASFLLINDGSAPAWSVNFGGAANDQIILDNVRMLNIILDPSVALRFSSLSSGSATLLPGTKSGAYVFTAYVKDDPTADQTQTAGSIHLINRLYASGLTIAINAAVKSGSGTYSTFFARPPGGWGSWTKLTVNLGFDFVDSDSQLNGQPALTIELSPTNVSNVNVQPDGNSSVSADRDVGSLLVAQPTLTYNP